jgi:hypothetical protein
MVTAKSMTVEANEVRMVSNSSGVKARGVDAVERGEV